MGGVGVGWGGVVVWCGVCVEEEEEVVVVVVVRMIENTRESVLPSA